LLLISPCFPPHAPISQEWGWAHAPDGATVVRHGQGPLSDLPPDNERVLVLPALSVSWHSVQLPKISKQKWRAVLEGLLEDRLLDDVASLHFALGPNTVKNTADTVWVAVCQKPWLQQLLTALEQAHLAVQRIVPEWAPLVSSAAGSAPQVWAHSVQGEPHLSVAFNQGAIHWPLANAPTPQTLGVETAPETTPGQATPETLALAETTLPHTRWTLHSSAAQWLQMAQTPWNLAQFDIQLAQNRHAGHRIQQALRQLLRAPAWRPMRWGVGALIAVQILGLNATAWGLHSQLQAVRNQTQATLQQAFPHITLVLDAPLQMERELARLRQAHGQIDGRDFEALLHALGQADLLAWQSIHYEAHQVTLGPQVSGPRLLALQTALSGTGWQIGPAASGQEHTRLVWEGQP
jgi:general secretion pathway protein L